MRFGMKLPSTNSACRITNKEVRIQEAAFHKLLSVHGETVHFGITPARSVRSVRRRNAVAHGHQFNEVFPT
jgi:hypothetical protein